MQKYPAVLEISRFLCMADDVTWVKYVEVVRIFNIFHTKLEIPYNLAYRRRSYKGAGAFIILYENMKLYGKNTEKFENGISNLKKVADTLRGAILLGQNRLICLSYRRIRQK